jgi:DNA-binding GntR family transcriptional regulator
MRAIDIQRPPPLAAIVEARIREAIMYGELALGEAVSEDRLATRLGVSRTPVREALAALSLQGLIAIQPQRGSFVFQPSEQDIADICDFRLLIERRAMALACERDRPATLAALETAQAAMDRAEAAKDAAAAARADADFHQAFIARCGNALIAQAYTLVSGRVGAIRYLARHSSGARNFAGAQHRALIGHLTAGDIAAADAVLSEHVMNMRAHFDEAKATSAGADAGSR